MEQVTKQELAQTIREHAGNEMPLTILVDSHGVSALSVYYSGNEQIPYTIQHLSMVDMDIAEYDGDYTLEDYAQAQIDMWSEMGDEDQ